MAAPTPVQRTLWETRDRVCRHITIPAGGDADVAATAIVDISTFTSGITGTTCVVEELMWSLSGFAVHVLEEATTDVHQLTMAPGTGHLKLTDMVGQGISNSAASGFNGDLNIITTGIAATDDENDDNSGFFLITVRKVV